MNFLKSIVFNKNKSIELSLCGYLINNEMSKKEINRIFNDNKISF